VPKSSTSWLDKIELRADKHADDFNDLREEYIRCRALLRAADISPDTDPATITRFVRDSTVTDASLTDQLNNANATIAQLRNDNQILSNAKKTWVHRYDEAVVAMNSARTSMQLAHMMVQRQREKVALLEKELVDSMVTKITAERDKLHAINVDMAAQLAEARSSIDRHVERLRTARSANDVLQGALQVVSDDRNKIREQASGLYESNQALMSTNARLALTIEQLRSKLNSKGVGFAVD
jgi:chromosome segregation ATPase